MINGALTTFFIAVKFRPLQGKTPEKLKKINAL